MRKMRKVRVPETFRVNIADEAVKALKRLRRPMARNDYERWCVDEAIGIIEESREREDEAELFRLWGLKDPRV